MRILVISTVLVAVVGPFCVLEAMAVDDDSFQILNPSVKKAIDHKLQSLPKNEGLKPWVKELGFESLDQAAKASIDPQGGFPLYSVTLDKLEKL